MEKVSDTWVTAPRRVEKDVRQACLVHIYPTGPQMGTRYPLNGEPAVLGRGDDTQIQINEHSVSRRHAKIELGDGGYFVGDLQSTNGTFVNDIPVAHARLHDGDYLRIGNCIYRFLFGGNLESEYHEEIYRLTIIDALTGAHNQRAMLEFLDRELARSARHQRPLSLVMLDVDRFKSINDAFGHLGGDFILRELAGRIRTALRKEDLFARYGGEEFGLVLVETSAEQAAQVAERIREAVAASPFEFDGKGIPVTISGGIAHTCGDPAMTVNLLIRDADSQLYKAKTGGRNQICC
jgi:diguanylate cyclase (GGDEF)-like protein